jgi:hypothetical protein
VPKLQVEFRTGCPTAEQIAAGDLCAEPMNLNVYETALRAPSKSWTEASLQIFQWKYIPVEKRPGLRKSQRSVIFGRCRPGPGRLLVDFSVMKAIIISRLGGPEVLELSQVPDPAPTAGHVLVRVQGRRNPHWLRVVSSVGSGKATDSG